MSDYSTSRQQNPRKTGTRRRPTKGQLEYIQRLRLRAGLPKADPPKTWATAVRQIDRLLVQQGREPKARILRPEPKPLTNRQQVKLSVARDLSRTHARESIVDEQARLKLAAAQRRAARLEQHKPDSTSAAD